MHGAGSLAAAAGVRLREPVSRLPRCPIIAYVIAWTSKKSNQNSEARLMTLSKGTAGRRVPGRRDWRESEASVSLQTRNWTQALAMRDRRDAMPRRRSRALGPH